MTNFSFVICTRNRSEKLAKALESIERATLVCPQFDFEVVLVDNGSADETASVFARWKVTARLPSKRIYFATPGLALSRNLGIGSSSGDVLIFIDDDCTLENTYCSDLLHHLAANSEPRILGGRVELGSGSDLPFTIKTSDRRETLEDYTHPGGFVLGCNMVVPRSVLCRIGGFDNRFGAGGRYKAAEDTDLLYRARRAGITVEYVPDMVVRHFHGRHQHRQIRLLNHAYHFGNGALFAKYFFSDFNFSKHVYWNGRNALKEILGGPKFEPDIPLSFWSVLRGPV